MDDLMLKRLAKDFGWSKTKVQSVVKKARELMQAVQGHKEQFPFDQTYEEMTDADILIMRTQFAEQGKELTPQEARDGIEIIKLLRKEN